MLLQKVTKYWNTAEPFALFNGVERANLASHVPVLTTHSGVDRYINLSRKLVNDVRSGSMKHEGNTYSDSQVRFIKHAWDRITRFDLKSAKQETMQRLAWVSV